MIRSIGISAVTAIALIGSASAQSASVDAVATPVSTTPPLVLTGTRALSFGEVNIPNGTEEGHKCRYQNVISTWTVYELDENGTTVSSSTPNPSGCDWGESGSPSGNYALIGVACNPASVVDFTVGYATGGVTGIFFNRPSSGAPLRAFQSNSTTTLAVGTSAGTLSATCPNGGTFDVGIGGRIELSDEVVAATDVTVGSITLDATY